MKLTQQDFPTDRRWEVREREESGMTPKFLARASRTELPFTEVTVGGTGLEEA